jgi:succinate dehydrogenase/fumarate reductase flavoprotein subunit
MAERWDEEADVVVVGFGGAGATAAIATAALDGEAIVLEKQPEKKHTPSSFMGGSQIMAVTGDVEAAARYLDRCAGGMVPKAVSHAWAEKASTVLEWIGEVSDVKYEPAVGAEHPEFEGAEAIRAFTGPSGGLFIGLQKTAKRNPKNVKIHYDSPASRLIRDGDGRVIGVEVATGNTIKRYGGKRGVVLTCGGYEYSEDMKINYLKGYPIYFYGNPGNTGDGVRMAQEVGADLWHMNSMIGRAIAHFELEDGRPLNVLASLGGAASLGGIPQEKAPGYVITDRKGKRFANEHMQAMMRHDFYYLLLDYDPSTNSYSRNPCYWFFDERRMKLGPPVLTGGGLLSVGYYYWSAGSEQEIAKGWFKRGNSIEEVAAAAGVDPAGAAQEIKAYNEACRAGKDRFGRPANTMIPLDSPPYYCMTLYPGGSNTSGGPRRNEHAQVVDVHGEPIPGLYEAGELGEPVGLLYPSNGGNISDCACFGQIAAEHALGVSAQSVLSRA